MIPVCREGHEHQKRRGATPARSALPPEVEKVSKLHNEDQETQHLAKPRSCQALGVLERERTAILLFFPVCGMMTTHIYLKFPMVDKTPVVRMIGKILDVSEGAARSQITYVRRSLKTG